MVIVIMNMRSDLIKWFNLVCFMLVIILNSLVGATTLIGGKTTAQVSDAYPTLVTPAGYVFSIWSVIYVLLGVFAIAQLLPGDKSRFYRQKIGYLFILSCILNIIWLFLWQYEVLLPSVFIMFMLLVALILIYLRLDIGRASVGLRERIIYHLPFSVYLGWITIASIANVAVALVSVNWDGFGLRQETWAIVIITVALLIASMVVVTRKDIAYGLVVIWALIGIAVKQAAYPHISIVAQLCSISLGLTILIMLLYNKFKR